MTLHRDLFVGEVAAEMDEAGCFGQQINLYCFWHAKDGVYDCCVHEDENECVRNLIQYLQTGYFVVDYAMLKERINGDKVTVLPEIIDQVKENAATKQLPLLITLMNAYKNKQLMSKENQVNAYFSHLRGESEVIKIDILGLCLREKWISSKFYETWRTDTKIEFREDMDCSIVAGFAWLEDSTCNYYANAYLPSVWKKLQEKEKQYRCSSIYMMKYDLDNQFRAPQAKQKLLQILPTVFDEKYFEFLRTLET